MDPRDSRSTIVSKGGAIQPQHLQFEIRIRIKEARPKAVFDLATHAAVPSNRAA